MCPEALGVRALLRDQFNNDVVFTIVAGPSPSPRAKTRPGAGEPLRGPVVGAPARPARPRELPRG